MARPAYKATPQGRKQVESMAGYGIPVDDIALSMGISPPTLRKNYPDELKLGHIKANTAVAQSLYKKALGDGPMAVTAAIFWAKTRMGWKDTTVHEHKVSPDLSKLTDDQLAQLERLRELTVARADQGGDSSAAGDQGVEPARTRH